MGNPLIEALATAPEPYHRCPVARLFDSLPADERAAVDQAVQMILDHRNSNGPRSASGANSRWLADALTANGYDVRRDPVNDHIGHRCSCKG